MRHEPCELPVHGFSTLTAMCLPQINDVKTGFLTDSAAEVADYDRGFSRFDSAIPARPAAGVCR